MLNQTEVRSYPLQFAITPQRDRRLPLEQVSPESKRWLVEYETQEKNIFNYYSIDNEVKFIQTTKDLPPDQQRFYLEENVVRFLAEFVGKVPYTTVPYSLSSEGFDYAGMNVMDSYKKAAHLGGEREKAETDGFEKIVTEMKTALQTQKDIPASFWISPPKNCDYGFVFALVPDTNKRIREYVLRYDEPHTSLTMSNYLMGLLGDTTYQNADGFLQHPLFFNKNTANETLNIVMSTIGIDDLKIKQSKQFEHSIESTLQSGIDMYIDTITQATKTNDNAELITKSKLLLIQLYKDAQRIQNEIESRTITTNSIDYFETTTPTPLYYSTQLDYAAVLSNMTLDQGPIVANGGSCPSLQDTDTSPFSQRVPAFTSSFEHLQKLQRGPLESLFKKTETSFACPLCGTPIPSGQGITECPNKPACGITKEQYAKMVNAKKCD